MKRCSKCKLEKEYSLFSKRKASFDGLSSRCKACKKEDDISYRLKNIEKINEYDRIRSQNEDRIIQHRISCKKYDSKNRKKISAHKLKRYKNDVNFRLSVNLRRRINKIIKNNTKAGSAIRDIGCSLGQLKEWLENKFQLGMTWNNWGIGDDRWQIDHINPLMNFDLTDREQFLKACHYTNLQPLWGCDHKQKTRKEISNLRKEDGK